MSEPDNRPVQFFAVRMDRKSELFLVAAPSFMDAMAHVSKYATPYYVEVTRMIDGNEPELNTLLKGASRD